MTDFIQENGVLVLYNGNAAQPLIPNSITEISAWAFYGCDTLISINIPSSVRKIGSSAFGDCKNLKSIHIPNSVTKIEWGTFNGCSNLKNIVIPDSVKCIDSYAFNGCKNLKSIKIPNSVTHIGLNAFNEINEVKSQYNNGKLRAFKGFNKDWTCRNAFQYKVGESYHQDGKIVCCDNGFHACPNPLNIFTYYHGDFHGLHFAEVELSGTMDYGDDKVAASDIKIIRELTATELAEIYNSMEKC